MHNENKVPMRYVPSVRARSVMRCRRIRAAKSRSVKRAKRRIFRRERHMCGKCFSPDKYAFSIISASRAREHWAAYRPEEPTMNSEP